MVRIDIISFEGDTVNIGRRVLEILRKLKKTEKEVTVLALPHKTEENTEPYIKMVCVELSPVMEILSAFRREKYFQNVCIMAGAICAMKISASEFDQKISEIEIAWNKGPRYGVSDKVQCHGLPGTIKERQLIYHNRGETWTWGYQVEWHREKPSISLVYLPEGYLQDA